MRYLGILMVLCSFPFFLALLGMGVKWRRLLFVALGALPILNAGFNLDAAFIDWANWPGHTKGLIVSLTDTLAIAICIKYSKAARTPSFLWLWLLYFACNLPGLFVADLFMPAFFYIMSLTKTVIYFYACYLVMLRDGLDDLVKGLALAIIVNGIVTIWNSLQGQVQAAGLIGHRNYAGMICNMAIPALLVAGTRGRLQALPILAILISAVAAALGGSRAVILLLGITIFGTIIGALWVKPSKQNKAMLAICLLSSIIVVPLAIGKLNDRFGQSGGEFSLAKDGERQAFERAARMMNEDYPLGVGANHYTIVSNTGGYAAEAGVAWTTISVFATVHNSYILVRTEGGLIALLGMLVLLSSVLATAVTYLLQRRANPARTFAVPVLVTTAVLAVHLNFEWGFVTMVALYSFAFTTALGAYVRQAAREAKREARATLRTPDRSPLSDGAVRHF